MKKFMIWLSVGVLVFGMSGCGNKETGNDNNGSKVEESPTPIVTPTLEPQDEPVGGDDTDDYDGFQGWTDEMEDLKAVVTDLLGENYFPNMSLDPEMLEGLVGISPDMYEDYLAEMPMISTNVDTLIIVKTADGQAATVEEMINAYRDRQVSNTMQYPQNVGKVQASKVERIGDYVVFVLLGGDVMDFLDQGDEAVITHCQEVNNSVIEAISGELK